MCCFLFFFFYNATYFFLGRTVLLLHKFNCKSLSSLTFYDYILFLAKTHLSKTSPWTWASCFDVVTVCNYGILQTLIFFTNNVTFRSRLSIYFTVDNAVHLWLVCIRYNFQIRAAVGSF